MQVIDTKFEDVKIIVSDKNRDARGTMEVTFDFSKLADMGMDFQCKEQRIYSVEKKGTFYGIHFQAGDHPQKKIVHLLSGRGMDYIVDLRKDSSTYKEWIAVELVGGDNQYVYIPQGYGHAFLTLEDNTIQLFTIDEHFYEEEAKAIRYDDPQIGLEFPIEITVMSDKDRNAPLLEQVKIDR